MFSQSKFVEQKISSRSSIHDTTNGFVKSFTQPKITSTPMRRDSIFATPPKPRLLSNHRYSLSDIATPPRTNRKDFKKSSMYQNSTGPLLASTQFNVNVSTYEDAKSPGLASRIVQYNEEAEREKEYKRPPTHQAKYGSPGLFPVVHLFKKKLPILEQKPRKVSVRLASPDHSRFQSQEYNRKLLEGIIRPGTPSLGGRSLVQPSSDSSPSTRSVLDALKEISRKRIHANEEYDLIEENGKRLRTEQINGDTNKRLRDDSPLLETSTSPGKQISKRVCVYDEYKASCSSSDFSLPNREQSGSKRKSISISTSTENPKESKLVKLINAETQTIIDESHISIDIQDKPGQIETPQSEIVSEEEVKQIQNRESPLKIFDDAPLERIRKNRLAALMGSLVGKDAVALTPKPDIATVLTEKSHPIDNALPETLKLIEKPLVSILTRNKSPQKSDKHVHFSIPETASQTTEASNISTSVVTTTPTTLGSASLISTRLETPTPPSSPINLLPKTAVTSVSQVIFGSNTSLSSTTNPSKDITSPADLILSADTPTSSAALVSFTTPITKSMSTTTLSGSSFGTTSIGYPMPTIPKPLTITSSPPKTGGFKFDLNKPVATATPATTTVTSSTFSFGNIAAKTVSDTCTPSSQPMKAVDFSFGSKTSTPSVIGISAVTTTSASFSTPIPSISASPSFNFGANTSDATTKVGFGNPTTQKSFGTPVNQSSFSVPTTKDNSGTPTTQSSFGTPVTQGSFATPTTQISFATPTTQSSFTTPTTQSSFATPTTQSSFATPTTQSSFATPTTQSSFAISTMQTNFGSSAVTTSTPQFASATSTTAGFGQSKPVFSFGSSANADKPNFVVQPNPAPFSFGASTTSAITNTSTGLGTVTTASGFGTTTMPSSFGASGTTGGFGTNMSSSGFGKPTSTGSFRTAMNSVGFGVSNKPGGGLFGGGTTPSIGTSTTTTTTTATSGFGSSAISTTSPFGSTNPPGFGASTTQSPFGTAPTTASFGVANTFGSTTTTNSPSLFVAKSNTNAFGTNTGGFGNQQPATTNIFGGTTVTQTSSFGAPSSNSVFGTTAPPPFGSSVTTTPTVGFGSNATPAFTFGAKTTNNVFGTSNTFGVTTANSSFGATATPSFGSPNSFGSSTTSFPANSNFGGANASNFAPATTTQVASYGTTNTPSFGAANVGGFGASSKPIFGNSTTPAFEVNPTNPAFGAAASSPGFGVTNNSLSFGSNSSRSAFAKPQPTANSFGSTPNTFGANNNFGASQQQGQANAAFNSAVSTTHANVFNFAAAAAQPTAAKPTGVFSFGASASGDTPKPSFNFTGGNAAPPAFGSGAPSFSNTVAPTFGVTGTPQFGAPQPVTAGVFNIGAGPPTAGRARTQLKAKRRT